MNFINRFPDMKHLPILLTIAVLAFTACSKDESFPYYVPTPVLIWEYEHTFTHEDWQQGYSEKQYIAKAHIEDWRYGLVLPFNTYKLGGIYLNGELIHTYKDGYFYRNSYQRGDLLEYDNYIMSTYLDGVCVNDGKYPYEQDILYELEIMNGRTQKYEPIEDVLKINITLREKPKPGETHVVRIEMWSIRTGEYLQ